MNISKKVVLIGHFGVGKSSLLRRFVENSFSENYQVTIGVHIMKKKVSLTPDKDITLVIWDVEGADDFTKYRASYLLGASSFIYVFDLTREATYADLGDNLTLLKEKYSDVPVHIIGNKLDLVDEESTTTALQKENIQHAYLSSAKTGENVELLFNDLAAQLMKKC